MNNFTPNYDPSTNQYSFEIRTHDPTEAFSRVKRVLERTYTLVQGRRHQTYIYTDGTFIGVVAVTDRKNNGTIFTLIKGLNSARRVLSKLQPQLETSTELEFRKLNLI